MRTRPLLLTLALLGLPSASCLRETPPSLEDSTGVRVQWECERGDCQVTASSLPPPSCAALPGVDVFVLGAGAVAILCGASVVDRALTVHESSCRPIVCADDLDCPQWDARLYGCDGGFCTTNATPLDALDVRATCLARVARPIRCSDAELDPATLTALASAEGACDATSCTIPMACQP